VARRRVEVDELPTAKLAGGRAGVVEAAPDADPHRLRLATQPLTDASGWERDGRAAIPGRLRLRRVYVDAAVSRSASASWLGGTPNMRRYSRLN
jgi:hypothetical protein